MRVIKFRGWDSENKKWRYGHFFETVEGIVRCYNIVENREVRFYCSPQSIGQFTGLKDKNGKEVYEGDVVRDADRIDRLRKVRFCNLSTRFEFVTIKQYGENILHGELEGLNINNSDWYEVIGNIYENPELIEQQ